MFKYSQAFINFLALSWSVFQVIIVKIPVNDTLVRSIHLAFGMTLAYLMLNTKYTGRVRFWIHNVLAIVAGLGALYLFLDYRGIASRPGLPITRDIVFGIVTLVLLLEASRRTLGLALTIMGSVFLAYCYFGPMLPDLIAHRGASVSKIIGHMYLGTEGIFGVPIRVSASFIFLFVLFGALLDQAGAGKYFIELAYSLLGRFRGGPAKASVAASGLLGMISGSSIANTVTTGTFTIPLMKKVGFTPEKAAAVEVAASTNAQLMPPVMGAAAFIMAEFIGISYVEVIAAAAIPAFVSYIGLFAVVHFEASKLGTPPVPKSELPPFFKTFFAGIHYIVPVLYLIYTLVIKRQSVSLAAFNAIILTMLIVLLQKPFKAYRANGSFDQAFKRAFIEGGKDLYWAFINGAKNMVPIAIATAAAGLIVGTITLTGLGQSLLEIISSLSGGNFYVVLVLTAVTCLILGMGLPTTANYIVMASLTAPILVQLADANGYVIPLIAMHLFVFYFGILADDTPPVGLAAYAAAAIAKSNPIKTGIQGFTYDMRTAVLPFMFLFNTQLLMIEGVVPGGSAMSPDDWIWNTNYAYAFFIFVVSCFGMIGFVSAITGWFVTQSLIIERLILLACFGLSLRPGFFTMISTNPTVVQLLSVGIMMGVAAIQYTRKSKLTPQPQ